MNPGRKGVSAAACFQHHPRLLAALWFGGFGGFAAGVPLIPWLIPMDLWKVPEELPYLLGLPVLGLIPGLLLGALLGYHIMEPRRRNGAFRSVLIGASVGGLSFVTVIAMLRFALWVLEAAGTDPLPPAFWSALMFVALAFPVPIIGLIAVIVGGAAGGLLDRYCGRAQKPPNGNGPQLDRLGHQAGALPRDGADPEGGAGPAPELRRWKQSLNDLSRS